jgi:hypothetical protein
VRKARVLLALSALDVSLTRKNIDKKAGPGSAGKKAPESTREYPEAFTL